MLLNLLIVWAALLLVLLIFAIGGPGKGGALTLAYFMGLSLIHVPGVLPFLAGVSLGDLEVTEIGFEMTIFGMAAFVLGAVLASWNDRRSVAENGAQLRWRAQAFEHLGWRSVRFGAVAYFVLVPLSFGVPSLTSIVAASATLLILGLWLGVYGAAVAADPLRTFVMLALMPLLPLATLVTGGILGYGIYWVLSVVAFLFVISRRRVWFYIASPIAVFLGLSLFVTYMGQRAGIRDLVWEKHAGIVDRLERISTIATDFQLLDLASPPQAEALDERLNQNWIVGTAVRRHEGGWSYLAHGATVTPWAFIPRVVWPDKPDIAGGGDIVSEFTGIRFASGTSVGAGQVLEFYVNFGTLGVLVGFFALGLTLIRLDRGIMLALTTVDTRGLLLRAMPGLTLLQPGGNLVEILVACVAAYVGARLVLSLRLFRIETTARATQRAV